MLVEAILNLRTRWHSIASLMSVGSCSIKLTEIGEGCYLMLVYESCALRDVVLHHDVYVAQGEHLALPCHCTLRKSENQEKKAMANSAEINGSYTREKQL